MCISFVCSACLICCIFVLIPSQFNCRMFSLGIRRWCGDGVACPGGGGVDPVDPVDGDYSPFFI